MIGIQDQLQRWLAEFNGGGATGQNRLVYTEPWIANQARLIKLGQRCGLSATVDRIGNVYLDAPGDGDQVIATGSHMDTVVNGGRYDGLLGVLGGLAAIQKLTVSHTCHHPPLRLISFSEEEGSRFNATFTGSRYYTSGQLPTGLVDADGIAFADARAHAVAQLSQITGVQFKRPALPARFTELHIEQGPVLERTATQVGLVTTIVAQRRYLVTVTGIANHAGTTPMAYRQDALRMGCALIDRIYTLGDRLAAPFVLTVGRIKNAPNASNVISGQFQFTIDCRSDTEQQLVAFEQQLVQLVQATRRATLHRYASNRSTQLDAAMRSRNQALAEQFGISYRTMPSGAGHDSQIMSHYVPTAMLFVPSVAGMSHCPAERTTAAAIATGVRLLTTSLGGQYEA